MADDPPYLTVGTEVSAKYKGAFCEAKIRKVVRVVKCKVTFKAGNGSALLTDDQIKGTLRIGAVVEAKHPDKNTFIEATINKIQDSSQYTVVFDDGDITTLRRSALCLKSGRHFNESETLDQLPLTHPEHFSNPVVGGRRGARRRAADKDDSSEEEEEEELPPKRDGRKKYEKELDMGKVVCVESTDKKKSKDTWFPALVVSPSAQETVKIRTKDEYLVRSFRDGRYYTVPKKEITEFTKDYANKHDSNSNVLRTAVDKALSYLERNELPPHWDREVLFSNARQSESADEDQQSESEVEDYSGNEEKDRFIAQLYKFMDDRSTPLNKVPQVCNKDLDLHKLFKMVGGKGGYTKVTNQGQWKAVTIKLGYGTMPSTSTINLVKQAYKKFLCSFEEFYRKLGCTWPHQQKSQTSTSKSRTSRSIFRERGTPSSSSRESGKDKKGGEDDDGRSTPSSTKGKDKPEKSSHDEKEKLALSSPEVDSPAPGGGDTGSESSDVKPKADPPEEIRKSARGRQPKKDRDAEESVSPSAASRKKRQATASRDRDRDSSVASSTKEESGSAPSTPSTKDGAKTSSNVVETSPTGKKGIGAGPGRGRYKRQSGKGGEIEDKEPPSSKDKEEEKVIETAVTAPVVNKSGPEIRLGDKLQVYYPKSEGKTYEAKVIDINETKGTFFVHYTGWNNRYDEWIDKARVSENITLKMEQSGEDQTPSVGKSDAGTKSQGPGAKQRKGRNSSSATSTTSASSGTTTSTVTTAPPPTTPGSTRSAKATIPASSSSPVSGKRRRSTSSEVVQTPPAVKRRRTRQRSGQDTAALQPSESEPETSDSDGKSIKSEKTTSDAANEGRKGPLSRKDMTTPTPASDTKTSGKKGTLSAEDNKLVTKSEKTKSRSSDLNDGNAASSSKAKDGGKHSVAPPPLPAAVIEDSKESSSSSNSTTGNGQVLDLDQIRSEMKGLDKMVKGGVPPNQSVSSPAPPTLSAVGGASSQSEASKVDVYEFMEDGAEDAAPPIPPTAPKLKMFSPVARSSTSPASASAAEKLDKSPVVSSSSAELVAKLGSTQDAQEKVPVVSIEKMDRGKEKDKTSKPDTKNNVEPSMKESVPKTVSGESPTSAVQTSTGKDTGKTSAAKIPPQITSFITHPITAAAAPATTSSLASAAPPLPILSTASGTPITVIASGISASSLTPITTAPVIIAPGTGPTITIPSTALKGKGAAFLTKATTVPVTATIVGNPPRIVSVLSSAAAASTIPSPSSSHPSPTVLISGNNTASVITPKVIATISPGTIPTTTPTVITTLASSITSPPPLLLQQPRPPVITLASPAAMAMTPSPKSTPERPALTPVVSSTSASGPSGKVDLKSGSTSIPFTARKQELFPNLIQRLPADPSATASIPTISIIAAKPSMAETSTVESSGSMSSGSIPPPQPVQQQPIKIAAAIPPPPPVVVKPPTKSTFGTSSAGGVGSHMDTPKQKKKKAKSTLSGQGTTPSQPKTLAPLPMVGAPPPPPVVITNMTTSTTTTITSTPTPGRKTPVKKRIPPPMESPGKPVKPFSVHGGLATPPTKPGKMNQEAMNAAIANVGATTPSTSSVPTTVITSTSAIFQPHPPGSTGIIFASALSNQPPPPPVNIASKNIIPPVTIKSSAESIAASIAAVASMGTSSMPPKATTTATSLIGKSGMPMKRFMKDNAGDKMTPGNKDKVYTISSSAPITSHQPVSSSQVTSSPNLVIGKSMQSNEHKSPQQHQSSHHSHHPPPSITIQAQFQPAHSMAGSGSNVPTTGPSSTTYVKSLGTPSSGNILDPHHQAQQHQVHPQQSNLPKNPVIIIPAAPVVIKPAPYQQQSSPHGQPMIVPKPVHVEGPYSQQASTQQSNPSILVTSTSGSATGKQQILPITVTPSNIQQVGHVASSLSSTSMHLSNVTTTGGAAHHRTSLPAVELKPVISSSTPPSNTADLPASITVTKATTVMKSVSPDIVAVSSYSSIRSTATSSSTSSFTSMKQENRAQAVKDPEIVVKPAPASTQIVFHTAPDSKKGITDSIHQLQSRPSLIPKAEEKDTDESSLLCEEIIPGSPTAGDPDDKSDDDTDKEMKNDTGSKKGKPDASVISMVGKDSPRSSSGGTTPRSVSGSGNKPVIVVGPKCGEDSLDEDRSRFVLEEKSCKFDDDEDDNKLMDDRSVDSPMGPPSEGREADLQFRDSFSEGGDQSPPLSPSTSSSISSDDSSRQHDTNRLSPTPEGGSSKSKDSDDDDMDSDVGSKSTHLDDADSKHGSTRGSTRIRNQSSRLGRSPSPPSNKRRRIMRRKSPEDVTRFIGRTIRTSSGRKITPAGRHGGDCYVEKEKEVKQPPPPPPVNLAKPPKTGKYNFIPNLTGVDDPEQRIALISQCINDLKEQYQKTKTEAASFDRRVKRWKRRIREKERLARQEATRAAS